MIETFRILNDYDKIDKSALFQMNTTQSARNHGWKLRGKNSTLIPVSISLPTALWITGIRSQSTLFPVPPMKCLKLASTNIPSQTLSHKSPLISSFIYYFILFLYLALFGPIGPSLNALYFVIFCNTTGAWINELTFCIGVVVAWQECVAPTPSEVHLHLCN